MDGHDRKELSPLEKARREYVKQHGSMLVCSKGRSERCSFMDGAWLTGCQRPICILDDPEDQILQKRIEANRKLQEAAPKKREQEEPAQVRNQKNFIQSYKDKMMAEIHRLEEASQKAFHRNNPNLGHTLFNRAGMKRQELKAWQDKQEERLKRSERNDRQSNSPDNGRNDEDE